jgi:uncharacterized protein YbaP (TraB family)
LSRTVLRIALSCAFAATAGGALAEPALWKISDEDSSVWLFGSMHIVDSGAAWRSPALDERIANADQVVFEMLLDAESMAAVNTLTMEHGFLPDTQILTDLLSDEEDRRLKTALEDIGLDFFIVARMQPWLAGVTIATMAMTADNQSFATGVETIVQAEVADERERGLETAEEQIGFAMAGTPEEQIAGLMQAVDAIGEARTMLGDMAETWLAGDVEGIHRQILDAMGSVDDPSYKLFVSDRNARWSETIAGMLEDDVDALIIVGAAHVAGPTGLPAMLEERGFRVERIDAGAE